MSKFRKLSDSVMASPQLELDDVSAAADMGVVLIINNRPDGEEPSAPQGAEIEAAARAAGMDYVSIPVGHSGFSEGQVTELIGAMDASNGQILAYCRSGTRSTLLWALAEAKRGMDPEAISQAALKAGYDVSLVRPMLDMFAAQG